MGFIPSGPEVWVILVIILIVFGAGKLPEIGGAFGKGIREFRLSQKDGTAEEGEEPAEAEGEEPASAPSDDGEAAAAVKSQEEPADDAERKSA